MSKLNAEILKKGIESIMANRKERKFQETIELQINLKVISLLLSLNRITIPKKIRDSVVP